MGKILCPVDGSEHSIAGLAHAIELAKLIRADLTVCTVNLATGGPGGPTTNRLSEDEVKAILDDAEATARQAGLEEIKCLELVGRAVAPTIMAYAEEIGANQIIMGTGDKRGLQRLVLGSVAAEVAGQAGCTVTIAR